MIFSVPLPPPAPGTEFDSPAQYAAMQSWAKVLQARGFPAEVETASGQIGIKDGTAVLDAGGALAMTIVVPVAGPIFGAPPAQNGDDFKTLLIYSITAQAHTVTGPTNSINGSKHILTFGAAIGNFIRLMALNGIWYALENVGVTIT